MHGGQEDRTGGVGRQVLGLLELGGRPSTCMYARYTVRACVCVYLYTQHSMPTPQKRRRPNDIATDQSHHDTKQTSRYENRGSERRNWAPLTPQPTNETRQMDNTHIEALLTPDI